MAAWIWILVVEGVVLVLMWWYGRFSNRRLEAMMEEDRRRLQALHQLFLSLEQVREMVAVVHRAEVTQLERFLAGEISFEAAKQEIRSIIDLEAARIADDEIRQGIAEACNNEFNAFLAKLEQRSEE